MNSFVETATNEFGSRQFAIRRDSELRGYDCFKLRSASSKLRLRHNPVAIGVELDKLSCVPDREDQRRLQAVRARTNREAAQPGIVSRRLLKRQQRKQNGTIKNCASSPARRDHAAWPGFPECIRG